MRKFVAFFSLFAVAMAGAALTSPTVNAADLPPPPPPPEIRASVYDWTGAYVGGFVGGVCAIAHWDDGTGDPTIGGCDVIGGVNGGYNYQFGNFVLGIEGDWGWSGEVDFIPAPADLSMSVDWLSTVRGRLGWLSNEDTLWYVTGGWGWADITLDALVGPGSLPATSTLTHDGFVVGGGVEHAFTSNIHARLEYLYADLSTETHDLSVAGCGGPPACFVETDFQDLHVFRAGITWNFGGWTAASW